jgi:cytochrome c
MKKAVILVALGVFLVAGYCLAEERATPQEAESMVKKAVDFYKANGKDKAIAEFNNGKGKFVDINKGLFLFGYDFSGKCVVQGVNAAMIGKDLMGLKDPDGKLVIKDLLDIAKGKGKGWYDYKWVNPASKKLETKRSYVERLEDLMIGCGFYQPLSQ